MNNQRLIPFLGGLVVGGVAGSQTGPFNRPNNYYYPNTAQNYPYYNNYPYNNTYNQYYPPVTSSTSYTYNQYPQVMVEDNVRYVKDLSFVPIYQNERPD